MRVTSIPDLCEGAVRHGDAQTLPTDRPLAAVRLGRFNVGLGWLPTRCLQAPPHPLSCDRCLTACPAEALSFADDSSSSSAGVRLHASDACHGCAQCVAACPTEALLSTPIETLSARIGQAGPSADIVLACHRVRPDESAQTLQCLRALGSDMLWQLKAQAGGAELVLQLPADCATCAAAPAAGADAWLAEVRKLARIEPEAGLTFTPVPTRQLSRRHFLSGMPAPSLPVVDPHDTMPDARRHRRRTGAAKALPRLTPPEMPQLLLEERSCEGHGVCARVCPTPALQATATGTLRFDPLSCIECGHCVSACPEGALSLKTGHQDTPRVLRQRRVEKCFSCRRPFVVEDEGADPSSHQCQACRRERTLMQESFHDELFR